MESNLSKVGSRACRGEGCSGPVRHPPGEVERTKMAALTIRFHGGYAEICNPI